MSATKFSEVIIEAVKARFQRAIDEAMAPTRAALPDEQKAELDNLLKANVLKTANPKYGDYQCVNAMSIFKYLSGVLDKDAKPKNPAVVATSIVDTLKATKDEKDIFEKVSAAGGFINVTLANKYISDILEGFLEMPNVMPPPPQVPSYHVALDFSSPNIAKSMHVGHLRSTIIGDTIGRLLEYCGCNVERINHVGDWGTQFGMLIALLQQEMGVADKDEIDVSQIPPIKDLVDLYKRAKAKFDEDEEFKDVSHKEVVRLQSGQKKEISMWQAICNASREEFQTIYDTLDIKLKEVGESFYNPMLEPTIKELQGKGIVEESNGALVIFCPNTNLQFPLILRKSDGGYGYDTTDMAALHYRVSTLKCNRLIYITDAGQAGHFQLVFDAARRAGFDVGEDKNKAILEHIGFGLVCGSDGKKFKTRSGETVKLIDLLLEAVKRSRAQIDERDTEGKFTEEEKDNIAKCIGLGAVKYADLSNQYTRNYIFDYDKMLSLKGNTAVYLLYCYARVAAIMRKAGVDPETYKYTKSDATTLLPPTATEQERSLALHLSRYPETIFNYFHDLFPHRLCDYLYNLSDQFMNFYEKCRVIQDGAVNEGRMALCALTRGVMKQGLDILGIKTVEKM